MEKTGKGNETTDKLIWGPAALAARREEVRRHQAQLAQKREKWIKNNAYFASLILDEYFPEASEAWQHIFGKVLAR